MNREYLVCWLLCIAASALAQEEITPSGYTDGGSAYEVCLHDNHIYLGAANTFQIYSRAADGSPDELLYSQRLSSNIDQILVKDEALYICANQAGLIKMDVSTPHQPTILYHWQVRDKSEAVYDVAWSNDTIFLAAKTRLLAMKEVGNTLEQLFIVEEIDAPGRIRGIDIKNNLLAYTVGYTNQSTDDGLYLYSILAQSVVDFFPIPGADPFEVYFGQEKEVLHVMGGAITSTIFDGYYAAYGYENNTLQRVFQDTIPGYILLASISMPMSAEIINDTVYIATHGGGPRESTLEFTGQVYVYDATDADNILFIEDLYAGLYHFDIAIDEHRDQLFVASEWYGIVSVDIADMTTEREIDRRRTGGWCHGSAMAAGKLVEANEGYGIRLFNVEDVGEPELIAEDTTVGFCRAISMSDDGSKIYAWYLTGEGLRIYDGNTLDIISTTEVAPLLKNDYKNARLYHKTAAVILEPTIGTDVVVVADVTDTNNPVIRHQRMKSAVENILFDDEGRLILCARDSIILFDPSSMEILASVSPPLGPLQPFKGIALKSDTLYVYYQGAGEGIARYLLPTTTQATIELLDASLYDMAVNFAGRVHMTHVDSVLFITSTVDTLAVLSDQPPYHRLGYYVHGGDFIFDNIWGVQDLYAKDGVVILNEYMGQTTFFDRRENSSVVMRENDIGISISPNPTKDLVHVRSDISQIEHINIYNHRGQLLLHQRINAFEGAIDMALLSAGNYIISLTMKSGQSVQKQFVKSY